MAEFQTYIDVGLGFIFNIAFVYIQFRISLPLCSYSRLGAFMFPSNVGDSLRLAP